MSIHPSLASKDKGKRSRSVLKRFERLKELQEKEKWKPGDSVFGLLKIKAQRWKVKKAKKAAETEEATAEAVPQDPAKKEVAETKKKTSDKK